MITPKQALLICDDLELWERLEMIEEMGDSDSIPLIEAYQQLICLAQQTNELKSL